MSCEERCDNWLQSICLTISFLSLVACEIVLILELIKNNQTTGCIILYVLIIKFTTLTDICYIWSMVRMCTKLSTLQLVIRIQNCLRGEPQEPQSFLNYEEIA